MKQLLSDLEHHRFQDACDLYTTEGRAALLKQGNISGDCVSAFAYGASIAGTAYLKRAEDKADTAKITRHGDHATVAPLTAGDDPTGLVYTDGRWRIGPPPHTAATAQAMAARRWPRQWCRLQPGMTRAQATAIMGSPTATQKAAVDVQPDISWSYGNLLFIAFLDDSGQINQLVNNNADQLSTRERAQIHCADQRP